jgi:hypothetical protein
MTVVRDIAGKDANLAVGDLSRRPGVLARDTTRRLALLEEARLVDHEHRILGSQRLDDIVAYDIAKRVSIPPTAAKDRLLPPRSRIACRFRTHPASLAPFVA